MGLGVDFYGTHAYRRAGAVQAHLRAPQHGTHARHHLGRVDVQQHQIRAQLLHQAQGLAAVGRGARAQAVALQVGAQDAVLVEHLFKPLKKLAGGTT